MTLLQLYLISILPRFSPMFIGFGLCLSIASAMWISFSIAESLVPIRKLKTIIAVPIILLLFGIAIPSEKQLMFIAGGYFATNNEEAKKLPENVLKAVNNFLKNIQEK